MQSAEQAEGSALEENERYLESIEGRIDKLTNKVQEFWYNFIDSETVKKIVDLLTWAMDVINGLMDNMGEVGKAGLLVTGLFGLNELKNWANGKESSGGRVKMFTLVA